MPSRRFTRFGRRSAAERNRTRTSSASRLRLEPVPSRPRDPTCWTAYGRSRSRRRMRTVRCRATIAPSPPPRHPRQPARPDAEPARRRRGSRRAHPGRARRAASSSRPPATGSPTSRCTSSAGRGCSRRNWSRRCSPASRLRRPQLQGRAGHDAAGRSDRTWSSRPSRAREDPRDVLACRDRDAAGGPAGRGAGRHGQPAPAVPGAGTRGRTCVVEPIRGNIDTRLRKLREGQYDAIVLAMAGAEAGGAVRPVVPWRRSTPEDMLPAPGQGALALQCRRDDARTRDAARQR